MRYKRRARVTSRLVLGPQTGQIANQNGAVGTRLVRDVTSDAHGLSDPEAGDVSSSHRS